MWARENFVDDKLAQLIDEHATLFAECDREDLIELEEQFELHNISSPAQIQDTAAPVEEAPAGMIEIGTSKGFKEHRAIFQVTQ